MSDNALDKVLKATEPNGEVGWIEWALYIHLTDDEDTYYSHVIRLSVEELAQLRARVAYLEKKLADVKSMQEEERE